jgi:hypothetical protein
LFLKIFIFHRLQQCFGFDLFCVLVCCSSFPAEIFAASKISFSLLGLADAGGVFTSPVRRAADRFSVCFCAVFRFLPPILPPACVCSFQFFPLAGGRWFAYRFFLSRSWNRLPPSAKTNSLVRCALARAQASISPPACRFVLSHSRVSRCRPRVPVPHDYRRFESLPSVFVLPVSPIRIRFVATSS